MPQYFVQKKISDSCCTVGEEMVQHKQLKTLSLYLAGSHSFYKGELKRPRELEQWKTLLLAEHKELRN